MIKKITLKNFRNFENSEFFFSDFKNVIIGENGKGKTNILEAISLFSGNPFNKINFDNLINKDSDTLFIEIHLHTSDSLSISYNKNDKKKYYFINKKKTTKQKLEQNSYKIVKFSPISMNIIYLSPSLRREFLDNILKNSFDEYKIIFNKYTKILISRNKMLKNIRNGNSQINELNFWNDNFIKLASIIYNYRFGLFEFLKEHSNNFINIFNGKIQNIELIYKTKLNLKNFESLEKKEKIIFIQEQIKSLLNKNEEIDILQATTSIGPHLDDFEISVDGINLIEFASRGEVKSVLLYLKELEIKFIEKYTKRKPLLLIDDLLSELDHDHKNLILKKINKYQSFITSIRNDYKEETNIIKLY